MSATANLKEQIKTLQRQVKAKDCAIYELQRDILWHSRRGVRLQLPKGFWWRQIGQYEDLETGDLKLVDIHLGFWEQVDVKTECRYASTVYVRKTKRSKEET